MNITDLFCGCGGMSYGFELAGYSVTFGIDNDIASLKTFLKNHKDSRTIEGDITEIRKRQILGKIGNKKIDVIIGGPPCQGMSLSGPRQFEDPRNKLYLSFIEIVRELEPKAVMIENVPGLVSLFKGTIKDAIIKRFTDLGYTMSYDILCASDYGVPQHRRRVFFVGIKGKKFFFPPPTHYASDEQRDIFINKLPMVSCEDALSDLPLLEDELGEEVQRYRTSPSNYYQDLMRRGSKLVYNHVAAKHSKKVIDIIMRVPEGQNYKSLPEELRNTRNFHVAWTRFHSKKPAPTIDTGHRHHFHYKANRVPTVRECARLQSFPDIFHFIGNKSEQFRQVGNAVPPLLAKVLATSLKEQL